MTPNVCWPGHRTCQSRRGTLKYAYMHTHRAFPETGGKSLLVERHPELAPSDARDVRCNTMGFDGFSTFFYTGSMVGQA